MSDPSECMILCDSSQDIVRTILVFLPDMDRETRAYVRGCVAYYLQRYGEEGLFARANNRTLAQLLDQYHVDVKPQAMDTGQKNTVGHEPHLGSCVQTSPRDQNSCTIRSPQSDAEEDFEKQISFSADDAGSTVSRNVLIVGVRGGDHYLAFQRDLDHKEPKQVYLEYDDQSYGGFDAVSNCTLGRNELRVTLSKQLGFLRGTCEFAVALSLDDDSFSRLLAGLRQVFEVAPDLFRE